MTDNYQLGAWQVVDGRATPPDTVLGDAGGHENANDDGKKKERTTEIVQRYTGGL